MLNSNSPGRREANPARGANAMQIKLLLLLAATLALAVLPAPNLAATPEVAGCAPGAEVPSFYVREVTSRRPYLATCLVCRYGSRPVVLLCVRTLNNEVGDLIERVDRAVDAGRGVGLRGFAIFTEGENAELQPQLATLARRRKTSLPLVLPVERGGPSSMQLPKNAEVTVLLYRDKVVTQRYVFAPGELNGGRIDKVVNAIQALPSE